MTSVDKVNKMPLHQPPTAACIIFSCDRAMQLQALLASYFDNMTNPVPVHIICRSSSAEHDSAYQQLFDSLDQHVSIIWHRSNQKEEFRGILLDLLSSLEHSKVFFLVDDILFIEKLNLSDFVNLDTGKFVPSLRMGLNLQYSYSFDRPLPLPPFVTGVVQDDNKICWRWSDGQHDWGYPMSVDGHLYSTTEFLDLIKQIDFNGPNLLEHNLHQRFADAFKKRYGVAYRKSVIVNVPCNRVQHAIHNRHGDVHQDTLLEKWRQGFRIDRTALYGFANQAVHQEIPFHYVKIIN